MKGASVSEKLVALIDEREREQARLARVLHDRVSQVLSAVGLQLDVMRMDFREQAPGIVARSRNSSSLNPCPMRRRNSLRSDISGSARNSRVRGSDSMRSMT